MNLSITAVRLELGRILMQQSSKLRGGSVHINLSGQQANTLLHDGQAWKDLVAGVIIREEHMQQTALRMPPRAPSPRVPGWKRKFPDYRKGPDQVIEAWRDARVA